MAKLKDIAITIGQDKIMPSLHARNLGVTMDSRMTMDRYISSMVSTSSMYLYNIGRIRKYLTRDATKTLIQSLVTSRFDYANSLLYGLPNNTLQRLQRTQNNAARLVTKTKRREHITPVLKELHWLKINERIEFKVIILAHQALYGSAPDYLQAMINPYTPNRQLR